VITGLNGRQAVNLDVLTTIQLTHQAGDTITVDFLRNGRMHTTKVTLAEP
jgi:S1-C subfamily serine protease